MREKTIAEYVAAAAEAAGGDKALGVIMGFLDGSRIGQIKKGSLGLSALPAIKLARHRGDNPIEVLRLAGHQEMADLLEGSVMPQVERHRRALKLLQQSIEMALTATE